MKSTLLLSALVLMIAATWMLQAQHRDPLAEAVARADALAHDVQLLEDENAIENLQSAYGYYTDKKLWTQVSDLFAADATAEFSQRGVVSGKEHIRAFLGVFGAEGVRQGVLANHLQLQPVVHVADDGNSAKGRWRALQMNGVYQQSANWGGGIYENEYVKEDGVWKLSKLHVYNTFYVDYDPGWAYSAYPHAGPRAGFESDLPPSDVYGLYPDVHVAPFHYPNPASGD